MASEFYLTYDITISSSLHLITLMISSDDLRIVVKAETESKLAVLFKK